MVQVPRWARQFESRFDACAGISALSFRTHIHLHSIGRWIILFYSHTNFGYLQHFSSAGSEVFPAFWQCSSSTIRPLIYFCRWFKKKYLSMNQAYLLLLYVTSDLFLLVSMVRSLKCCQQRRSALMVSNEVSTRVDLYSSCLRFCKWAGIHPPMFHLAIGWNSSAHGSFRNGLEFLRPCFISQWAGIAPPMFCPVGARLDFCFFV